MNTLNLLYKNKIFIIAIALIAAITAFILTYLKPVIYDVSVGFTTHYISRQESANNSTDDEYSVMKAAGILGENIESWFLTPSFVKSIYEKAELEYFKSIDNLSAKFIARQYASQNIVVRFQDNDREKVEKLSLVMPDVVSSKVSNLNQVSRYSFFSVKADEPVISEVYPNAKLAGLIGFICGFIIGGFIITGRNILARN